MAVITFPVDRRRRMPPPRKGQPRGEIVIFSGVRIERIVAEQRLAADTVQRRPGPVQSR